LSNIYWGKTRIDIEISGKGEFFAPFNINGNNISGTAQIPSDLIAGESISLKIRRTQTPFDRPILLNSFGLPVTEFSSEKGTIAFTAGRTGHYPIEFFATEKPKVFLNNMKIEPEYDGQFQKAWIDLNFNKGDKIEVQC
jgi:hypothetical protein